MAFFKKILLITGVTLLLTGCINHRVGESNSQRYQEDILLKANNYNGLIAFYRQKLKQKEDTAVRIKLAEYYYASGDYASSLYYLQPLRTQYDADASVLEAKNLIALGKYSHASQVATLVTVKSPDRGDAWNLRGIALTLSGDPGMGRSALEKARSLFIEEDTALNNLAMNALIEHRDKEAVALLMPQYLRGSKNQRLIRNLVMALIRCDEKREARNIIANENLAENPDELVDVLTRVYIRQPGVLNE